jgi:hypothetical protein
MLILTSSLFLQISLALSEASFCRLADFLDELPFVRFLLKDLTRGQLITGRTAALRRIKSLLTTWFEVQVSVYAFVRFPCSFRYHTQIV